MPPNVSKNHFTINVTCVTLITGVTIDKLPY